MNHNSNPSPTTTHVPNPKSQLLATRSEIFNEYSITNDESALVNGVDCRSKRLPEFRIFRGEKRVTRASLPALPRAASTDNCKERLRIVRERDGVWKERRSSSGCPLAHSMNSTELSRDECLEVYAQQESLMPQPPYLMHLGCREYPLSAFRK
uniref:Uncharacterized protein n=1 Tax=Fagus sylvatica TaxID=28930 RepID=A0A2N9HY01_FAGSY